jgi:hypothetical protein
MRTGQRSPALLPVAAPTAHNAATTVTVVGARRTRASLEDAIHYLIVHSQPPSRLGAQAANVMVSPDRGTEPAVGDEVVLRSHQAPDAIELDRR